MALVLAPEVETILEQKAAQEGISIDTLIRRTFAPQSFSPTVPPSIVPPDDPVLNFLNARIQEAENATKEEITAADAEYQQWQRNMNETRRANNERLLFPDVTNS